MNKRGMMCPQKYKGLTVTAFLVLFLFQATLLRAQVATFPIDSFDAQQIVSTSPGVPVNFSATPVDTAIGGTRDVHLTLTEGPQAGIIIRGGLLLYQTFFRSSGGPVITWDADLDPNQLDSQGLAAGRQGVDLDPLGEGGLRVGVEFYDWPFGRPVELEFVLYDASDPGGDKRSIGTVHLERGYNQEEVALGFDQFQAPAGGTSADLSNIGAIQLFINGADATAIDLSLDYVNVCTDLRDTDGDGLLNCDDPCPIDPNDLNPLCGCNPPDSDGDGTPDCMDDCPDDPAKVTEGICGCGVEDSDHDNNGTPDCHDPECEIFRVVNHYSGSFDSNFDDLTPEEMFAATIRPAEGAVGLQCLQDILLDMHNICITAMNPNGGQFLEAHYDNCMGILLTEHGADGSGSIPRGYSSINGVEFPNPYSFHRFVSGGSLVRDKIIELFFDRDCNSLDENLAWLRGNSCNEIIYWNSNTPISLLLDNNVDLQAGRTVVQFPLDLRHPNNWQEWKASEEAPLLVYDPENSGTVRDATRLFGNWTFGGQRYAALQSSNMIAKPVPWKNGFEALATFDMNNDKRLDGKELQHLRLWKDRDRDARVDSGELVNLAELGITALFFEGALKNKATGSYSLEIGYERMLGGQKITGRAVDWISKGSSERFRLRK